MIWQSIRMVCDALPRLPSKQLLKGIRPDESMEAAPLVERMKKDGAAAAGLSHPIPVETQARSTVVEG